MLDAAAKALAQMFTPPFRTVLLKSVGLAIALLAVLGIALYHLLEWLTGAGETWAEGTLGPLSHGPLAVLGWILAFALGFGLLAGAVFLMPAVTALVASRFPIVNVPVVRPLEVLLPCRATTSIPRPAPRRRDPTALSSSSPAG